MLLKHKAKMDEASKVMEESKARIDAEDRVQKSNKIRVDEMLSWAERYDGASDEAKHLIIAALIDRIEVRKDYEIEIHFRVTAEQFLGQKAPASA